jgi:hypothetical protein
MMRITASEISKMLDTDSTAATLNVTHAFKDVEFFCGILVLFGHCF